MMQHVEPKNICDAIGTKRELLRVGDGIKPRAPDEVGRENVWRELLEKTWPCADFDRDAVWFARRAQARKKFIIVDAPQDGFLLPNTAVPKKLLLSLRIDSHGVFFDCTEFPDKAASKAGTIVSTGN
jgi:hypothetical protein